MATAAVLTTRIAEVEGAIHSLAIGQRTVEVTAPNGTRASYDQTTIPQLRQYLLTLRQELQAATTSGGSGRRPIYFDFGR